MKMSRDFLVIFLFIMPMLGSSAEANFQGSFLPPSQLSEEDFELDPLQLSEEDFQLNPSQLTEDQSELDPLELTEEDFQFEADGTEPASATSKATDWLDLKGKAATQSNTAHGGAAARAIDGNANPSWGGRSCTHTHGGSKMWWQVDLGSSQQIWNVKVTNRGDCCGSRLSGFSVLIDDKPCASSVSITQGKTKTVPCEGTGKVIRVQLNKNDPLTICEFGVQAGDTKPPPPPPDPFAETAYGKKDCPGGYAGIFDEAECKKAQQTTGKRWAGANSWGNIQGGCFSHPNNHVWFNKNTKGTTHGAFSSVCKFEGGCTTGWPQIKDASGGGTASSAITGVSQGDCAEKCAALSTCGSFKYKTTSQECSFNTFAQSTTEAQIPSDGDTVFTCKRVFSPTVNGSCPADMKNEVTDKATCKDGGPALGHKWGGASSWNNIPPGCAVKKDGATYFNEDDAGGSASKDFSKICTSLKQAPPKKTSSEGSTTTTPSLTSVCTPGVCTKGKWAFYLSGKTSAECKAKCEESRRYVPVPDGIQEDVYVFQQNGRFHDVTAKMPSSSRKTKTINYPGTGSLWKGWKVRDHFYARWSGYIEIKAAGKYTFNTRSDDGSRLFIDDKKVTDNAGWHGMRDKRGSVENLAAGKHKFSAEMFEGGGGAGMEFKYSGPDTGNKEIIVPENVFSSSLTGSSKKMFNPEWKDIGMCQAYSSNGGECVIYTSCTEVNADKESLVCEDNSFEWVEPSTLTTCKYQNSAAS